MRESNRVKIIITIVVALVLQAILSVVFMSGFTARHASVITARHISLIDSLNVEIQHKLQYYKDFADAQGNDLNGAQIWSSARHAGFSGIIYEESSGEYIYHHSDGAETVELKPDILQSLQQKNFVPAYNDEIHILDSGERIERSAYYLSPNGAVYIMSFEGILSSLAGAGFDNVMFVGLDKVIDASAAEDMSGKEFEYIFKSVPLDIFSDKQWGVISYGGERQLVVTAPLEMGGYIAAYSDYSIVQQEMSLYMVRLILLMAAFLALSLGALFIVSRSLPDSFVLPSGCTVRIGTTGSTLKRDKQFIKRYGEINIFEHMHERGVIALKLLKDEVPLTATLHNKIRGEWEFVYIIPAMLKSGGYLLKVSAVNADTAMLIEGRQSAGIDEELSVFSGRKFMLDTIAGAENLHSETGIFMMFDLSGLEHYRLMFGDNFYSSARKIYTRIVSNELSQYGGVYALNQQQLAFLSLNTERATLVRQKLSTVLQFLNEPVEVDTSLIQIKCLCGVAEVNKDSIKDLTNYGNLALARAKELGKTMHVYDFSSNLYPMSESRKVQIMQQIIDEDMIESHFQPQLMGKTGKIWGFESLCRLKGRYKDILRVQEFIELAEKTGHMIELGNKLMEQALKFSASIQHYNVTISLNVSPVQLMQTGFVSQFLQRYHSYGLKAGSISMEITETFLMTSFDEVAAKLDALYEEGIKIHLDDFGVAYSSMLYLKKLPLNAIKIDKEFVSDIAHNEHSRIICGSIINLSKELGLSSIAEGVETQEQSDILLSLGCDVLQGFLIGRAAPGSRAEALLNKHNID